MMSMPDPTLLWYDYETTGVDRALDRPMQFAAQRTTLNLEPVDDPINLFCGLPLDVLPQPVACLLTGLTPQQVAHDGLDEAEFAGTVRAVLAAPGTCSVGYNSIRFDDEINRHLFYRNFFDPYAHAWADGTTRWDIVDLARACYALRPDGIEWPRRDDGHPSFKLEHLASANRLEQSRAHDAGSDVTATIELARLLRSRQPKLYDWHFKARDKNVVAARVTPALKGMEPLVHVSARYPAEGGCLALVVPIAESPGRKPGSAWIVADLGVDPAGWMHLEPEDMRERLYTRREDLPEDVTRPPLKTVQANRSPFVAPANVLRPEDAARLGVDVGMALRHLAQLRTCDGLAGRIQAAHEDATGQATPVTDPELELYAGFFSDDDRRTCARVRNATPEALGGEGFHFRDSRLTELLLRYRARNWPRSLSSDERARWHDYVHDKLCGKGPERALTLERYRGELARLRAETPAGPGQAVLDQLTAWGVRVADEFDL